MDDVRLVADIDVEIASVHVSGGRHRSDA